MSTTEHDLDASTLGGLEENEPGSDGDTVVGDTVVGDTAARETAADDRADRAEDVGPDELGSDQLGSGDLDPDDDRSEPFVLPSIVPATEIESDTDTDTDTDTEEGRSTPSPDDLEVTDVPLCDDVLDELRRADIDGPSVPLYSHDDSSSAHRRPMRSPEYDPAPMPIPINVPRILGRKPRVRRVTRVVRHVDPWSVFKIAVIANLLLYVTLLVAGVLLWNVANATGTVDNVERFFESFGWTSFEFNGGEIYNSAWTAGLFLVIGFTGLAVLAATMFNLITDLVGGMRFTVLEEEVVEMRASPLRRFVVRRPEPEIPLVTGDASGPIIREGVVDDRHPDQDRHPDHD